jgi:hypothetical protein
MSESDREVDESHVGISLNHLRSDQAISREGKMAPIPERGQGLPTFEHLRLPDFFDRLWLKAVQQAAAPRRM